MDNPNHPIASLPKLKQLGMDITKFGSCAEQIKEGLVKTIQKGCMYAKPDRDGYVCPWRSNLKFMQQSSPKDKYPRPRHVRYRHVKQLPDGTDAVLDGYCTCWQWHQDLAKRNGKNGEVAAVTGGEGDEVTIRTSEKVIVPGSLDPRFDPQFKKITIPRYPDPEDNKELAGAVYSARAKKQLEQRDEELADEAAMVRMGLSAPAGEKDDITPIERDEVAPEEKPIFGRGSRSGGAAG